MEDKAVAKKHTAYVTVNAALLCIKYLDEHGTPPSLFIHHDSGKKKKEFQRYPEKKKKKQLMDAADS